MFTNKDLVDHLIDTNSLYSEQIIDAFTHIDRKDFILNYSSEAYYDCPLPIGENQTISQPTTVAMMFEMLSPKKGESILDIGSGSGWTTALLSYIVKDEGSVTGLERIDELVELGRKNLQKYNFKNSKILKASDTLGIDNESFDKILVSASAEHIPYELTKQLKEGGKLVIPVRNSIYEITKEKNDKLNTIEHYGFVFVPLIYKG
ncbi:protein-L-isoaspartate O-methyltransferase [Sulfurimonas sp.]|uniref:protein-L-isoaspartate O-methyltransferase n=1 Tax=Sulfurimonas sp. TaxID=2022749 RepID=UPI0035661308